MARLQNPILIYYAHCMADYGKAIEILDIGMLKNLGFKVENPNTEKHSKVVKKMQRAGKTSSEIMDYFIEVVDRCDAIAFRALPDGSLTAGVSKEINHMKELGRPIIELPYLEKRDILSVESTRSYIRGRM